jgi:Ca2+-transporting ATPase
LIAHPVPIDRLGPDWPRSSGLTSGQALDARRQYGPNQIVEAVEHPWWALARDTAKDPMIWFFAATSALYAVVGQTGEAATLIVAIVPLVLLDVYLHRRTQASTEGLKSRLASTATVLRDGASVEIAARDVVPGDLALVTTGDMFPADGIVLDGADLQVEESSLTGESYPVRKRPVAAAPRPYGERRIGDEQWGFAGTRLLTGRASLLVAFTGGETLYGEIVRSARDSAQARTPLQQAIQRLVTALVAVALVMCAVLVVVRLRQGHGWMDAIISAVTLATAALPEEFPVVFAFFLGVGVYRLAGRGALVRRAVSVENIGRVTCICSDKTGTITEGTLRLAHLVPVESASDARLMETAAAASRPENGDPLDVAIFSLAAERSLPDFLGERVATFPFTEDRKRETAVWRDPHGKLLAFTKGAAEVVLDLVSLPPSDHGHWTEQVAALGESGHKVIACAWRPLDGAWVAGEPAADFQLAGLLGFEDPVREGVGGAVAACQTAGIQVIMVTGDHPATARAVAREIGLAGDAPPDVISGEQMQAAIQRGEGALLRRTHVIARAAPAQKHALVRALQANGEIVAVTGDGVNDVPALQAADVGIAMGERGTRSAREVASIVLLDDNFRTIVQAIGEGRQLFKNLQLSFQYILMMHIPLVITAALIPLAGYPLLYLPVHIVWLEMLIHPTALLVFQAPATREGLLATSRSVQLRFFTALEWVAIVLTGVVVTGFVAGGYLRSFATGHVDHGRAMALAILTLSSASITTALGRLRTRAGRVVVVLTVAMSVILTQIPALAAALDLEPLHADDWALATAASLAAAAVVWVSQRAVLRRRAA